VISIAFGRILRQAISPPMPSTMTLRSEVTDELIRQGAVAVVRLADSEKLIKVVEAVAAGGVTAIEITLTTPGAMELIAEVSSVFGDSIVLGVGTVLSRNDAEAAIDAGARYVVSPIFNPEVVGASLARGIPALPGAMTPTEIQTAMDAGAGIVKIFPANAVGMDFFKAVLAPMPHCRLMPTGGVTLENAGDWIRAGACAVGVGSALISRELVDGGQFDVLTQRAATLKRSIEEARA